MFFLNGELRKEVYMQQSPRFVHSDSTFVCKLKKSLYALKQAPSAWYEKLHQDLLQVGFSSNKYDRSFFVYKHQDITLYELVYVDDILLIDTSPKIIHDLITKFNDKFFLKKVSVPKYFISIEVQHQSNGSML